MRFFSSLAVLGLLLTGGSDLSHGQSASWKSGSSGSWSTGSNWTPATAPGSTSSTTSTGTATFNNGPTVLAATITVDQANQNIGSIAFGPSDTVQYTFIGNPLLLSSGGSITSSELPQYTQTFDTSLVLEPASSTSNGSYTFAMNQGTFGIFDFAAPISGGTTTGSIALNLGATAYNSTISGAISNGGAAGGVSVTQNGGQWTLSGSNTYTGPTTISNGVFTLKGTLSSSSALVLNSAGFVSSSFSNNSVHGVTLNSGLSSVSSTAILGFGAFMRSAGAMIDFGLGSGSFTTSSTNTNGLLGPWAVVGTSNVLRYATVSGGGQITSYFGATSATAGTLANVTSATTNYDDSSDSSSALTGNATGNTLAIPTNLDTAGHTLTLNGLIQSALNTSTISGTGPLVTGSSGELDVTGLGTITISAPITGTGALVYGGVQTFAALNLSGANLYQGGTVLNSGLVTMSGAGTLGATNGNLNLGNARLDLNGTSQQVGSLNGTAGTIGNNAVSTTSFLTVGAGNATGGSFSGTLADSTTSSASGFLSLIKTGSGTQTLSGNVNSYSGGTLVGEGTLYINGGGSTYAVVNGSEVLKTFSGSGNGTVAVISGATLGGSGLIRPTRPGAGVTLESHSTFVSGSPSTTGGMTLDNTVAAGVILDASVGSVNLTFDLRAGNISNPSSGDFASPNTNSTYLTVLGNTLGEIALATGDTITVNDDTGTNNLQLSLATPYLLIAAGTNPGASEANNDLYSGLITSGGLDGHGGYNNGWVMNLGINGTAAQENPLGLYLYNGELEIVPEPGTWALLLGGGLLLEWVRRRRNAYRI